MLQGFDWYELNRKHWKTYKEYHTRDFNVNIALRPAWQTGAVPVGIETRLAQCPEQLTNTFQQLDILPLCPFVTNLSLKSPPSPFSSNLTKIHALHTTFYVCHTFVSFSLPPCPEQLTNINTFLSIPTPVFTFVGQFSSLHAPWPMLAQCLPKCPEQLTNTYLSIPTPICRTVFLFQCHGQLNNWPTDELINSFVLLSHILMFTIFPS